MLNPERMKKQMNLFIPALYILLLHIRYLITQLSSSTLDISEWSQTAPVKCELTGSWSNESLRSLT